jgi:hypothetical protein
MMSDEGAIVFKTYHALELDGFEGDKEAFIDAIAEAMAESRADLRGEFQAAIDSVSHTAA